MLAKRTLLLGVSFCSALQLTVPTQVAAKDQSNGQSSIAEEKVAHQQSGEPTPSGAKSKGAKAQVRKGIYYGRLGHISEDRRVIVAYPVTKPRRRQTFYLDKQSAVYREKKLVSSKSLKLGEKIAVRYFGEDSLLIVDAVYLVKGEFVPRDYLAVRKAVASGGGGGKASKGH